MLTTAEVGGSDDFYLVRLELCSKYWQRLQEKRDQISGLEITERITGARSIGDKNWSRVPA
jgi:hypothetical protein